MEVHLWYNTCIANTEKCMTNINAHQVRALVFNIVPEYKPLRRVKCSVGDNYVSIQLCTGLLDDNARTTFTKVGILEDNKQKLIKAVNELVKQKHVSVRVGDGDDRYHEELCISY